MPDGEIEAQKVAGPCPDSTVADRGRKLERASEVEGPSPALFLVRVGWGNREKASSGGLVSSITHCQG